MIAPLDKTTTSALGPRPGVALSALGGAVPPPWVDLPWRIMAPVDALALEQIEAGALVVVNHSGGKDSQAMLIKLRAMVPPQQLLVIHAHLAEVEWPQTEEWARYSARGLDFVTVQAGKTFLGMVESRGQWPSPKYRQCTSDLKRGPIEKAIRAWIRTHGLSGVVINAMGMRGEESCNRSKLWPWQENHGMATARGAVRRWFDWLPVHHYSTDEVFAFIERAGERPHWAYGLGMSRLSCSFCIMSSKEDLKISAQYRPETYSKYLRLEKKIGKTIFIEERRGQGKGAPKEWLPVSLETAAGVKNRRHLPVLHSGR